MRFTRAAMVMGLLGVASVARADSFEINGPLPSQKTLQVRLEQGSAHLPDAEVRVALSGAIRLWSSALPADLTLVEADRLAPIPRGEVVILVRFDADASHFGGGTSVDELGDVRLLVDKARDHAIVAIMIFDKPGSLSTDGKPATRDLELVLAHELGHALGCEHVHGATTVPPIMAPVLEENAKVLAGGKSLASVRQLSTDDKDRLEISMLKRQRRDISGSYTGELAVTKTGRGVGGIPVGHKIPVREGDFVVTYDGGYIRLDFRGSKRHLDTIELLFMDFELKFPAEPDLKPLRTLNMKRTTGGLDEIEVNAVIAPLKVNYEVKGVLKKKL